MPPPVLFSARLPVSRPLYEEFAVLLTVKVDVVFASEFVTVPVPAATPSRPEREPAAAKDLSLRKVAGQAAADAERRLLLRVLNETRWNRKEAASQLKISYKALLNKLKKWEVDAPRETPSPAEDAGAAGAR